MSQIITQMMHELIDAWNAHDVQRAGSFYAEDYQGTDVAQRGAQVGREARVRVLEHYIRAFPDLHFTGDSIIEGNRVVLIWTMSGTHQGKIMGIPATGQKISVQGVSIMEIEDGLIARGNNVWDTAGFLRAMRLLPEL
jgi:steroid delta-isomerase-like uncharacterized protein